MSFGAGALRPSGELGDESSAVYVWSGWRSGNGGHGDFGKEEDEVF